MKKDNKKSYIGRIGEDIACRFLMKHGFKVLERNYNRKWGELDIVCKKGAKIHFIEVKTVSHENNDNVSYETINPADNLHRNKLLRISRVIRTYLAEKCVSRETEWQLDAVLVELNMETKEAKVDVISNILLEER